ncbi:hypothetical protein O181_031038 [Austropuccinia psidii MF-1]|uniref:Uncharacterized protein n=1 Tax=Austropuccinia psidii MF-1 TaxID=1389203 RepID=A0A9Q3CYU4_9BASI|nr:hypothetical protein [Austropuccinia psidii MF-1]
MRLSDIPGLVLLVLTWVCYGTCRSAEEDPKPTSCDGVLMVNAVIPEILGVNNKPFTQFVGNLSYSLSMNGTLVLNNTATLKTWQCGQIKTQSHSTSTMRTLKNVYASAQMECFADFQDIDSSWVTKWSHASYGGLLYVSIIAHDGICATPPTLLDKSSPCNYNTTSDGGLKGNGQCRWLLNPQVHNLGDPEPSEEEGKAKGA